MWRPMEVKSHWEIKKNKKKQNVETYGPGPNHRSPHFVKPWGNPKNQNNVNVKTNGGEKPLGNPKKQKRTKCRDQWG